VGCGVWGVGCGVWGVGCRVYSSVCRVEGLVVQKAGNGSRFGVDYSFVKCVKCSV